MHRHKRHYAQTNYVQEAEQIKREESLYPAVAQGVLNPDTAHFLATHPDKLRKWQEDQEYFNRFNM